MGWKLVAWHIVCNLFWIKKTQASYNEGKFHTHLKCRISICNKEFNFSLDIRVSMNLAFFEKIGLFLALFEHSCTGNTGYKTEPQFFVTSVASTRVLKNSPIFSKNAKFTLTLMSKEKLNFLLQIQILHFKYVWNLPSLSLARFFLIQNELRTMC